ncbi:MAG: urease accessory protein UreD [Ferruginibacter sp.]
MIAKLHIIAAMRGSNTFLQEAYFTPPLKVADITEDKNMGRLHLMIMSSSPGILDGDQYELNIALGKGCALHLHTQSYQRLFNMKGAASQSLTVHLSAASSFCFLPHPSVPHAGSVFESVNKIYLEQNCSLVFGEIVTCGRKLNGEIFLFSKYHSITEIFLEDRLVIKENLLLEPRKMNLGAIGQLEKFTHQASLIYLHPTAEITTLSKLVNEFLLQQQGIIFGISSAPVNGLVIRILGHKAEQLHHCLEQTAEILTQQIALKTIEHAI